MLRVSLIRWPVRQLSLRLSHTRIDNPSSSFAKTTLTFHHSIDITNSPFSHTIPSKHIIDYLDEPIMLSISTEACPLALLEIVISKDPYCSLAHLLILFQYLKKGKQLHLNINKTFNNSLYQLHKLNSNKALNHRETLMYKAFQHWLAGDYTFAGNSLEKVLWSHPTDLVCIRLAQDAFLAAGDSSRCLRVTLGSSYAFNDKHLLYAYYIGQVSNAFLEDGKYIQAEEFGLRAIEASKGQDFTSLKALMSVYLMQGRSSECTGLLDYHSEKHETSNAIIECSYYKARAFILRGNYSGALRQVDDMLVAIASQGVDAYTLALPTILVWLVQLNSDTHDLTSRWRQISSMWKEMMTNGMHGMNGKHGMDGKHGMNGKHGMDGMDGKHGIDGKHGVDGAHGMDGAHGIVSPAHLLCAAIAFSSAAYFKHTPTGKQANPKAPPLSLISSMMTSVWSSSSVPADPPLKTSHASPPSAELDDNAAVQICDEFYRYIDVLASERRTNPAEDDDPRGLGIYTERGWLLRSSVVPISNAMRKFATGEYNVGYAHLAFYRSCWNRVGGSVLTIDLIEQTLIVACIKAKHHAEARRLLSERTAMVPNDSQSWRRLGEMLSDSGEEDEANEARYTAWQLGIGQGGFGGPK